MITIRPSVFCFIGKVAPDLYGTVPMAIRRRLGVVPDVFAFISMSEDTIDLKIGTRRPKLPKTDAPIQARFWQVLSFAAASIGNIRIRTDALRRPAEIEEGFQVVRGGPDIHLVQCLSDPMGWERVFAIAEKIHERTDTPPGTGRARGLFPLFHLPSSDEDAERDQALEGLRKLEALVRRGVLFPSVVFDRVNRNGYPLERWEDLVEILTDFISLGAASEAAPDLWRVFPQVADLHSNGTGSEEGPTAGLTALGLARFRFNRDLIAEHIGRIHMRDVKRSLHRTFSQEHASPTDDDCHGFLNQLAGKGLSLLEDGVRAVEAEIVDWVRAAQPGSGPSLGTWSHTLSRLQLALFEKLGESAQRIENVRQDAEALGLDSPLQDTWIARISVLIPPRFAYLPPILGGALAGSFIGMLYAQRPLAGFLGGGILGGLIGATAVYVNRRATAGKETFTLGEFPESTFPGGLPVPKTLERITKRKRSPGLRSNVSIQLWGELRSQVEPGSKERIDTLRARFAEELATARKLEHELIFLDRSINTLRERVEGWRTKLAEVEIWETGRGFSGDIFPSDGPRKIYEWLAGRSHAEKVAADMLPRITPWSDVTAILELADEASTAWGKDQSRDLGFDKVLQILDDKPEDLLERLSEASAPLWPRPGDGDELLRCFGADFARFAKGSDVLHSLKDETIFVRVLGGIRSGEFARA